MRRPNQVWATDATCVLTGQGWLYLVAVLDVFTRRVIGWAMTKSSMLAGHRRSAHGSKPTSANGTTHHPLRSRSPVRQRRLPPSARSTRLTASMSRKGNCYDNAFIESFWSSLKYELVYHHRFATFAQARTAIFDYIETFYNRTRLHSSLAYQSPINFESTTKPNYP